MKERRFFRTMIWLSIAKTIASMSGAAIAIAMAITIGLPLFTATGLGTIIYMGMLYVPFLLPIALFLLLVVLLVLIVALACYSGMQIFLFSELRKFSSSYSPLLKHGIWLANFYVLTAIDAAIATILFLSFIVAPGVHFWSSILSVVLMLLIITSILFVRKHTKDGAQKQTKTHLS